MEWAAGLVVAALGGLSGLLVPRLIGWVPEPEPDPDEVKGDFPDKIPYADLAARPKLWMRCVVAGLVIGAVIGLAVGWSWGLLWLVPLISIGLALAIIDYATWYLPTAIIAPAYILTAVLVAVGALAVGDAKIGVLAGVGYVGLGGYYGLMWFISPRIMAFGDVRLGALIGLAIGPFGVPTLFFSVLLAAVVGVLALIPLKRKGNSIKRRVPFGPFLLIGAVLALVVGQLI
ncbi:A24 family peptidase [Nocardioides montaniterrae]